MPSDLLNVLLAIAPPLTVLILMVGFRWGGSKAGPAGWLVALVIALLRFGAGGELLIWAHVRAVVLTIDVVLVVWAALGLYFVVREAGALTVIADWFTALTTDDVLRVLLLGWVFTSFLQGVGGFGVPIAVVAPLLVGLGLPPLTAVIVPALGHAWAVTFGSLGSSFIALIGVTGQDPALLAPPTAILLGVGALACGTVAAYAYGGWRGLRRGFPAILTIGTIMAVVQYIVATNGLWNIGSATAGLAGLATGLWVTRWRFYRQPHPETVAVAATAAAESANPGNPPDSARPIPTFPQAISGYVILVILAVLITGVQPIKTFLGQVKPAVHIPEVQTSLGWITPATPDMGIRVLAHTGSVLFYSALIAYFLFRSRRCYPSNAARTIVQGVWQKGKRPAIGILSMVAMATVMQNAGMTRAIAEWLSQAVPPDLYAFVGATIGTLGAFMTGSNTNSNAVFAGLQMDTALLMGLSVPMVLAIQTASAAIASLMAPAKILVGASTVGISGDEGLVLRNLLLYGGILLLIIAGLGFVLLQLGY